MTGVTTVTIAARINLEESILVLGEGLRVKTLLKRLAVLEENLDNCCDLSAGG